MEPSESSPESATPLPSTVIKYGTYKDTQLYLDKTTGKKFTANGALPGRRIPPSVVGDAIGAFYDGLSYRDIQRRIESAHGFKPSTATIYEWVRDYAQQARKALGDFQADTGDTWAADEMVVKVDGEHLWLWNVMDVRTRYLLATHLSKTRTIKDAQTVFKKAEKHAKRPPKAVLTDGLRAYQEGIERTFGGETKHLVSSGITSPLNNNLVERLNGTVRERTKVMRGMETKNTAEALIDGFVIHYNHMKPHEGLGGRTPAQAADILLLFKDWGEVAHLKDGQFRAPLPVVRTQLRDRTLSRRRF
jgi:transposase-like protein